MEYVEVACATMDRTYVWSQVHLKSSYCSLAEISKVLRIDDAALCRMAIVLALTLAPTVETKFLVLMKLKR